jgi:hypothetical protein
VESVGLLWWIGIWVREPPALHFPQNYSTHNPTLSAPLAHLLLAHRRLVHMQQRWLPTPRRESTRIGRVLQVSENGIDFCLQFERLLLCQGVFEVPADDFSHQPLLWIGEGIVYDSMSIQTHPHIHTHTHTCRVASTGDTVR